MAPAPDQTEGESVLDRLVHHALLTVPERPELEELMRRYYAHVDDEDLAQSRLEDLFGSAVDHLQLAEEWTPGTVAIAVRNPRVAVDGWGSDHTVVHVVTDDMPFLVDSVMMAVSNEGIGIHQAVHPILDRQAIGSPRHLDDRERDGADGDDGTAGGGQADGLVSLISVEIDRQASADDRQAIDDSIRRVLGDVAAAVADFEPMASRMRDISAGLTDVRSAVEDTSEKVDRMSTSAAALREDTGTFNLRIEQFLKQIQQT